MAPCAERITIRHGIRALQLSAKGLKLNGKPLTLRGKIVEPGLTPDEANRLRDAGFNAIWTTLDSADVSPWNVADRAGLFVLGSGRDPAVFPEVRHDLANHPSHFGWIFNRADLPTAPLQQAELAMFYGVNTSAAGKPEGADFLVCHGSELAWLSDTDMPKLAAAAKLPDPLPARADLIGWIETPTA